MSSSFQNFDLYQKKFEPSWIPFPIEWGFRKFKAGLHQIAVSIDQNIKLPDLMVKTTLLALQILGCLALFKPVMDVPKLWCRDIKNMINFLKGFKAVDGLVNLQTAVRRVVLNVSGLTLMVMSFITIVDRFKLLNVTAIKLALRSIPIFGVLSLGGLPVFGLLGLSGALAYDRKEKIQELNEKIKNQKEKIAFWSMPLTPEKIEKRNAKTSDRIIEKKQALAKVERLEEEGKAKATATQATSPSHQLAMQSIRAEIVVKTRALKIQEKISEQWEILLMHLSPGMLSQPLTATSSFTLSLFQRAKLQKWKMKLIRSEQDKKCSSLGLRSYLVNVAKQILILSLVVFGMGTSIPLLLAIPLDCIGITSGLRAYFLQKKIQFIKVPPISSPEVII